MSARLEELHGFTWKNVLKWWFCMPIYVLLLSGIAHVATVGFYNIMPASYWIEYDKISTSSETYPVGIASIDVYSHVNYKREKLQLSWLDELHCRDLNGRWYYVGSSLTYGKRMRSDHRQNPKHWLFNIKHPSFETDCQIRSTVTVMLPDGLQKSVDVNSNIYKLD